MATLKVAATFWSRVTFALPMPQKVLQFSREQRWQSEHGVSLQHHMLFGPWLRHACNESCNCHCQITQQKPFSAFSCLTATQTAGKLYIQTKFQAPFEKKSQHKWPQHAACRQTRFVTESYQNLLIHSGSVAGNNSDSTHNTILNNTW